MPTTSEELRSAIDRENSAKMLCGGMVGDCYLLQEAIEGLMTEALAAFKNKKWYRQQLKHDFRMAHQHIHTNVVSSATSSIMNADYMREMADLTSEALRFDLFSMENGLRNELAHLSVPDAPIVSKMLTVDIMLQYTKVLYDDILNHCSTIYGDYSFYDSWYNLASCRDSLHWWERALDAYSARYIPQQINLKKSAAINNGLRIIQKKLRDFKQTEDLRTQAMSEYDPGAGEAEFQQALRTLGITA